MIRVALLDDGLDYKKKITFSCEGMYKAEDERIITDVAQNSPINSHGFICAHIIYSYSRENVEIVSYRVKRQDEEGDIHDLETAFNNALDRKVDIIHMSIGSCESRDRRRLKKLCNKAKRRHILVIAATDNDGAITYPAFFKNVIGVGHNIRGIGNRILYIENSRLGVDVEVCSPRNIKLDECISEKLPYCNSFAAAEVTGIVALLIDRVGKLSVKEVRHNLKNMAYKVYKK